MADINGNKLLAPGVSKLLMIYRLFNKVDNCRGDCNFLYKSDLKEGLRVFHDYDPNYHLLPFACGESKKGVRNLEAEVANLSLQAGRDIAGEGSSRDNISYELRLIAQETECKDKEFWGDPFRTLLQVASGRIEIDKLYRDYGTHYIYHVKVGLRADSHSESNQSSNTKRNAVSTGFPLIKANLGAMVNKSSMKGKSVSNETQTNYGDDGKPIPLLMRARPLWKLKPVEDIEGAAAKLKHHFFCQLEQQRNNWSPPKIVKNFREDDEPGGRACIDSKGKEWFLVVIDDEELKVKHDSTLCSFNCIVDREYDGARFQIWKPETQYNDLTDREYRLMFDMEVNLREGKVRYEVTVVEHIDIKSNYVIGIMIPSNVSRNRFSNYKHSFTFPIKCKPNRRDDGTNNKSSCWRMEPNGNMPQLKDRRKFKHEEFKDEAGHKSVPLIGLEFKVSDIAYYKHMICDDPNDIYEVEFDDTELDPLKSGLKDWKDWDPLRIDDILEKLNQKITEYEEQVKNSEKEYKTDFIKLIQLIQYYYASYIYA